MHRHYERQLHELDMIAFAAEQALDAFVQENAALSKRCLTVIGRYVSDAYRRYLESDSWPRLSGGRDLRREFVDRLWWLFAAERDSDGSVGFLAARDEDERRSHYKDYELRFRGWPEIGEYGAGGERSFFGFPANRVESTSLAEPSIHLRQLGEVLSAWVPSRDLIAATIGFNLRDALAHQAWYFDRIEEDWMPFLQAMHTTHREGQH